MYIAPSVPPHRVFQFAWGLGLLSIAASVAAAPPTEVDAPAKDGTEVGVIPIVGGDTDHGFGIGAIGSIADFGGDSVPYRWHLEFAAFAAVKGSITSLSQADAFVKLIIPELLDGRLRLEVRPSFTRATGLRFFGFGNAIDIPNNPDSDRDYYTRTYPQLQVLTGWRLHKTSAWSAIAAAQYLLNKLSFASTSTIATELVPADSSLGELHSLVRFETGLRYDSRDNELAPNRGMYHALSVRASPHLGSAFPYGYEQIDLQLRFYQTLSPRNVLALRAVGDAMLGSPPFYEEGRYDDNSAIGGSIAVRGVPAYTFYGKLKLFGNVELRTHVRQFTAWNKRYRFGVASFFDAGRLWADERNSTDGHGLGLHYGIGGGLRLQQGRAFLVRADIAWSPDARPIGGYLLANHIF